MSRTALTLPHPSIVKYRLIAKMLVSTLFCPRLPYIPTGDCIMFATACKKEKVYYLPYMEGDKPSRGHKEWHYCDTMPQTLEDSAPHCCKHYAIFCTQLQRLSYMYVVYSDCFHTHKMGFLIFQGRRHSESARDVSKNPHILKATQIF